MEAQEERDVAQSPEEVALLGLVLNRFSGVYAVDQILDVVVLPLEEYF